VLGVAQGIVAVVHGLQWVHIGSDLAGRGLLMLPIIALMAIARGVLVGGIAILYVAFAWGALHGRKWAPGVGLAAALLNGFDVVNIVIAGEPAVQALPWAVVPVILIVYLLSPAGHRALARRAPRPDTRPR
jgi:hypothetical protein